MQRQLAKQKVWETEMKRQFKPMKPVAIGCIWSGEIPPILKRLEACHLVESRSIDPCMPSKDNQVPSSPIFNATAMPVPEEGTDKMFCFFVIVVVVDNWLHLHPRKI